MKFGIFVFPGSNCDHDCYHAVRHIMKSEARFIWHQEPDVSDCDALILPGGFSYGDYLRPGAIAKLSPAVNEIISFAGKGGLVIGICNGFQILLESGLLPGAMLRNKSLQFICKDVFLKVVDRDTPFTRNLPGDEIIKIPIAHEDGSYYADKETLDRLQGEGSIVFQYCTSDGEVSPDANPNGSQLNIAGIRNEKGNVLGMMPHPERAVEETLGGTDGRQIFQSIIEAVQ